jgi:hypothetical protein
VLDSSFDMDGLTPANLIGQARIRNPIYIYRKIYIYIYIYVFSSIVIRSVAVENPHAYSCKPKEWF